MVCRTPSWRRRPAAIRLKLLKLGARVTVSVRRIKIAIASACPRHAEFAGACRAARTARLSRKPMPSSE